MLIAHSTFSCALAYEGTRITRNRAVVLGLEAARGDGILLTTKTRALTQVNSCRPRYTGVGGQAAMVVEACHR